MALPATLVTVLSETWTIITQLSEPLTARNTTTIYHQTRNEMIRRQTRVERGKACCRAEVEMGRTCDQARPGAVGSNINLMKTGFNIEK